VDQNKIGQAKLNPQKNGVNSIKLPQFALGFQKTTKNLFVTNNYQNRRRLFQKTQMAECFIIDRDYDSWGPRVGELIV
jgi:hypothetical protein